MKVCPNINLPEWKALTKKYGRVTAMQAYIRNGYDIPNVSQAEILLALPLDKPTQQVSKVKEGDVARKSRIADIITTQLDLGADLETILNRLLEQGYVTKNNDSVFTNEAGRDIIIFNIEGITVPVYRSFKGTDSKTKGKW